MVRGQSISARRGRFVRRERSSAPRMASAVRRSSPQFGDHLGDDDSRGTPGLLRHHPAQRDEVGNEAHVSFDSREEFGLDQHLAQALPLERVLLDHLDYRRGEELANVAQPFRDPWCRRGKSAAALLRRLVAVAIKCGEGVGHAPVALGEGRAALAAFGIDAEGERPAASAFVGPAHRGAPALRSSITRAWCCGQISAAPVIRR
jgi:hypothetical protein